MTPASHHEPAVRADHGVGDLHDLALGPMGVAEHGHVEVGGPQPGHGPGAVVADRRPGQVPSEQRGLLPGRRHETGDLAAVLGAVADRVHVRVAGAQLVVDDHPAPYVEARPAGQRRGRPAAGGEDDEVSGQHDAVVEHETVVGEPGGAGAGVDAGPEPAQVAGQDRPGAGVDLAAQQVLPTLDDLDRETSAPERAGHLQAEQAAADHDRRARAGGRRSPAAGSPPATGTRAPSGAAGRRAGPGRGSAAGSGCCRWPGRARRTAPGSGPPARPRAGRCAAPPPATRGGGRRRRGAAARGPRGRASPPGPPTAGSGCTARAARRPGP